MCGMAADATMSRNSPIDWLAFDRDGYVRLGRLLDEETVRKLQDRIDAIMLGQANADYHALMMQLDVESGDYADLGEQTLGFKGPTLSYRKVEGLERDPVFGELVRHPVAAAICRHVYGPGVAISTFRSMFMNKPTGAGTPLPWHQDRWVWLDRDPLVTVYTALDAATEDSGCVRVIVGSHRSVVNPLDDSSFLEETHYAEHCPADREIPIELTAGEMVVFHNWLIHRSGVNRTGAPRRAFSACYMEATTIDYLDKRHPVVFYGDGRRAPIPDRSPAT